MRIATWNIERFKHRKHANEMHSLCQAQKADILVLTETDRNFSQHYPYEFHTPCLSEAPTNYQTPATYGISENRVSIYTRYPCLEQYNTSDKFTSICVKLKTDFGNLMVYGTIIGITGNRSPNFKAELLSQVNDIEMLSKKENICVCGDYNCSFSDNYYFTNFARDTFLKFFTRNKMQILTIDSPECIDHIAISTDFTKRFKYNIFEWNLNKSLSDHKGIGLDLQH